MELNNNFETKVNSASVSVTPSTVKSTEASRVNLFPIANKNAKNLTENEIKYLQAQGYDISTMSDADIQNALIVYYEQMQAKETVPAQQTETQATTETTNSAETSQATQAETVAQKAQTQPQTQETAQVQAQVNNSPTNTEMKSNNKSSVTEVKIDYDSEDMREFVIMPDDGVDSCDFYNLPAEERENYFINALAKRMFGEQWESMSPEEKAQALKTVESNLAENVPSWKKMNAEDKGKLALAFFAASDDEETRHLRYDGDCDNYDNISAAYKKSFNEQVEIVAKSLVETRAADTKEQEQIFNQTILEKFGKNREAKKNYYSNQLNYLLEKKMSGAELNEFEEGRLELLSNAKAQFGKHWQRTFSDNLNADYETSTFALMSKDEHYQEIVAKRKAQYYHNTNDAAKALELAEKDAKLDWIKHQFEDVDKTNKRAVFRKLAELRNNCHSLEEQAELIKLCQEIKNMPKDIDFCDTYGAQLKMAEALKKGPDGKHDENVIRHSLEKLSAARAAGNPISDEGIANITAGTISVVGEENQAFGSELSHEFVNKFGKVSAQGINEATKEGLYSVGLQEQIYGRALKNVTNTEGLNELAKGIGHTDDSIEVELSNKYSEFAVNNKNSELLSSLGEGLSAYADKNQTNVMKTLMDSSYSFDDETAIRLQKGFSDQVASCAPKNQAELHKQVMSSKFEEVQVRAAENIKTYDASAQLEAIDEVYSSGNKDAIEAIYNNISSFQPSIQNEIIVNAISGTVLDAEVSTGNLDLKMMSGMLTVKEIAQLTPRQKQKYFIGLFIKATPAQKLQMMQNFATSNMIGAIQKKVIYTMIARSSYLKDMVESGMGKLMLEAGLPVDATNKVINAMKFSTNGTVIEQRKELAKDSTFRKYFEEEVVTQKANEKKYATPMNGDFIKGSLTPMIDSKTRAELIKNKSTMFIKS